MPIDSRPIRVLLIEDNQEHAELLERLLSFSEFPRCSVAVAGTLAAGTARLAKGTEDLVLLDLSLPDSQGVDTFRQINSSAPETPIVILSGIADLTVAIEMVQEGAQDYLVKGHVDTHLLLRSIQYAIERKRAQVAIQRSKQELEARVRERTAALVAVNERLEAEVGERKQAEEQLLKSNRQLTVALAELRAAQTGQGSSEKSDVPAREIEDVFKRIQQHSEIVLRAPAILANPAKVAEHLQQVLGTLEAGRKILRKAAQAAEPPVEALETVSVEALVDRVLALIQQQRSAQGHAAASKVTIIKQVDKGAEVRAYAVRLRDMLAQLVLNSMNAIPRRGTVTVSARQQGGEVILSVQDDGLGITEAARQRLLNPAVVGSQNEGRASGYALVHEVVARHRGRLEIESRKGLGTTVRVILPAAKPSKATATRRRVLVVDDDPMVREVISTYLGEDGYTVELADNGIDALKLFNAAEFDIVLTDRSMPGMDGCQLALEIKKQKPEVPVLLLTGYGDIMQEPRQKPEGVAEVLSKPFTMAGLQTALAKYR